MTGVTKGEYVNLMSKGKFKTLLASIGFSVGVHSR